MPHVWHLSVISESGRSNLFKNYIKSEDIVVKCLLYPMSLMAENKEYFSHVPAVVLLAKILKTGSAEIQFFISLHAVLSGCY